jgi:hypothetical protein
VEIPVAGLIGAMIATALGAAGYVAILGHLDAWLRQVNERRADEDPAAFEERISVLRRALLFGQLAAFAAAGYWAGTVLDR